MAIYIVAAFYQRAKWIEKEMFMERAHIPRQQGNVGIKQEFSAFNLSALQMRLKTLNSSTLGQMGQIQSKAVLQKQQLGGAAREQILF